MKTVLITGGGRGIGKAAAIEFSRQGWNVIINYNKSKNSALALAESINATAVCADITNSQEVLDMHNALKEKGIHIDCIVNNSGIAKDTLFTDISEEEWDEIFNVNVKGAFLVTKEFLPDMISRKSGSIINISSIWGETGAAAEVHYSASKAALIGMSKALAKELAPSNIRVNCVCPGYINPDMNAGYTPDEVADISLEIPMLRTGNPDEVAAVIEFLASEKASYITGQVLGVSGGWYI